MRAQHVLLLLGVGVTSAILGYVLGYALSSEWLIELIAGSGSGEWERSVVGDLGLQAFCAGPLLLVLGSVFPVLAVLLDRLVKVAAFVRCLIVAAFSFIAAFVAYFPFQVLLLVAAAF